MKIEQMCARVLADWRGLEVPVILPDRLSSMSEVVGKLMKELGLKERLSSEEVIGAWGEVVGEFVARHSTPQQLKDGVLTVRVLQPTVQFELERFWKKEILAKLKTRFGNRVVREIRFRIG